MPVGIVEVVTEVAAAAFSTPSCGNAESATLSLEAGALSVFAVFAAFAGAVPSM